MDRRRAETEFNSAKGRLEKAIGNSNLKKLKDCTFPDYDNNVAVETKAAELEKTIEKFSEIIHVHEDRGRLGVAKEIVGNWFQASYPYVQAFLTVAKEASSVAQTR